jgi:hypothetical protein
MATPASAPTQGSSSDIEPLKIVGQIGGPTQAVAVAGNYAYVGVGSRLVVLDTSAPDAPREIGSSEPVGSSVEDVSIANHTAFVAAGGAGLYTIDISNPACPTIIGNYDTPGYAEGVTVADQYAYVADGPGGLRIVDIADPAKPTEMSAIYSLNYVFNIVVKESYAYMAAAGAGLLVADVSDPVHPVEVSNYDTPGYAYGITASASAIYIADGWEGLQVLDVSNPKEPKNIWTSETPGWAMDVVTNGDMLYMADASGGLRVLNVADKANPMELGSFQVANGHAAHVALGNNMVYVADIHLGIHIVDVSVPTQTHRVGLYSPMGYAQGVAVANGYAYVAALDYGFRVIDLADPAHPREVAAITTEDPAVSVALSGTSAYVATTVSKSSKLEPRLFPVNISEPLHPKASPTQAVMGASRNMFIQGTTLYHAVEWGLLLLDISNPLAPREFSFLQTTPDPSGKESATATGVVVAGNIAYLAVSGGGLYMIDVSDPRQPALLGAFNEPAVLDSGKRPLKVSDVVVSPPFAYILDVDILRVVDVSDPKHLKGLGSLPLPVDPFVGSTTGAARSLAIDGNKLYIADSAAGLLELDVTDPANPRLTAELRLPGLASWVFVEEGYVYVADGASGLFIIRHAHELSSNDNLLTTRQDWLVKAEYSIPQSSIFSQATMTLLQPSMELSKLPSLIQRPAQRLVAGSTYIVSSAADSGPGTLRELLAKVVNGDTITFDAQVFPPDAPVTIQLTSGLPVLSQGGITIDASEAGVILDGSATPEGTNGLSIDSNNNIVMGLQILYFPGTGIGLGGQNNIIGGDRSRGKGQLGQGNLISGNRDEGINVCCDNGTSDNRIVGNYIGTDITGMKVLGNGYDGIVLSGINNIIGGQTPGERNVISGNGTFEIVTKLTSGNLIVGNYVGLDASGRNKLGNPSWSIAIWSGSSNNRIERNVIAGTLGFNDPGSSYNEVVGNYIGTDASGTVPLGNDGNVAVNLPFNKIGGTKPGEANVINGRITISTSDVIVMGNLIGIDSTGKKAFPNSGWIVNLGAGAHHNFIGGMTEAERNVIDGGKDSTLVHLGSVSDFNFIAGNYLGTDISGTVDLPNFAGISLEVAEHNAIQGNLIAGSQAVGVSLASFDWDKPGANFNWLRANRITQNKVGIAVGGGEGNTIVGNSFIKNSNDGSDRGINNRWDNGTEGNYWSDYKGEDKNGDGIGDIPFNIPPNGIDNYPLIKPP